MAVAYRKTGKYESTYASTSTWMHSIMDKLVKTAGTIGNYSRKGTANYVVVSPEVAAHISKEYGSSI
jgi:hypothetical protein